VTIEELKSFYDQDPRSLEISQKLRPAGTKLSLRGLVGSGASLVASSLISNHIGAYLFVLNDKEEAAYFYNDLENILGKSYRILFFPRSARVPYQLEQTENANIAMRAEVLNEITRTAIR
jgi:transcription-repair coupling factor (superfamily II helicase)